MDIYCDNKDYVKFRNEIFENDSVYLIGFSKAKGEELPDEFVTFDSQYVVNRRDLSTDKAPEGDVLIFFFFKPVKERLFTLTKKWTGRRESYYKQHIGKPFQLKFHKVKKEKGVK